MLYEDVSQLKKALDTFAEAFQEIEQITRSLPESERSKYLNPDTFGPISQFLQLGNGYEPAYAGSQFHNMTALTDDVDYEAEKYAQELDDGIQMDEANESAVEQDDIYHSPEK